MRDSILESEEIETIDFIKPPDNRPWRPGCRWARYASIHDVVLDLGRHYKVKGDLKEYTWRGIRRSSFANAFRSASLYTGLRYAGGYVTPMSGAPFLHGWCLTRDDIVIDPTLSDGEHYHGLPLRLNGGRRLRILARRCAVLGGLWPFLYVCRAA